MKKFEHRYLLGYKVLYGASFTDRGVAQFFFKCEECGKKIKSTVSKLHKRGKCDHKRSKSCKKVKKIVEEKIKIDVMLARHMVKFMTINKVADLLGVTKEELFIVL